MTSHFPVPYTTAMKERAGNGKAGQGGGGGETEDEVKGQLPWKSRNYRPASIASRPSHSHAVN